MPILEITRILALLICPSIKLLIGITCSIRYLQLLIQHYCKHLIIEAGFHNIATREKKGICGARNLCTSEYIGYTTPIKKSSSTDSIKCSRCSPPSIKRPYLDHKCLGCTIAISCRLHKLAGQLL